MYEYIIGNLISQGMDYVVVDCNRLGYHIRVSANTLNELPELHEEVMLYLHQIVKEDELSLYGFASRDEREIFRTIIGISGIGPKGAVGLLSCLPREEASSHI